MTILADFLRVLHKFMSSSLLLVLTPAGLFVTVISSVSVAVGGMFSRFTFFSSAVSAIQSATSSVESIVNANYGALGEVFLGFFAVDRIVQTCLLLLTLTIGVSTVVLITIFLIVFTIVPVMLGIRALLKAIQVFTAGLIQP